MGKLPGFRGNRKISLTPGFSQVITRQRKQGNRLNGFLLSAAVVTWLKPGVNDISRCSGQLPRWCFSTRLHRNCWHILVAHELVECRHLGLHDLGQLRQLSVDLYDQFVVNRIRLIGRRSISALHYAGQRRQFVIEPDGEIQGILTAPVFRLIQTLLDRKSTRLNSSHIQKSRMPSSA